MPTIFNVVLDAVVRHWESLVGGQAGGGGGSNENGNTAQLAVRTIRERDDGRRRADEEHASLMVQALFFYADDGLVAYIDPGWLQSEFDTLTGIFDRVGLR